jgi:hypothetical protein
METTKADLLFYPEPLLSFGYDQCLEHPKDGLTVFGPIDDERKPSEMRVGVIGTPEGLSKYRDWVERITKYIPPLQADSPNHTAFPGFEAAFRTRWPVRPVIELPISAADISRLIRIADRHVAIYETVSLFAQPIQERYREDDLPIDIWYVVIPEEVYQLGRPRSRVPYSERVDVKNRMTQRIAQRFMREPSLFSEDMVAAETYKYEINFHHQLKARLIEIRAVIQIVRDTSLDLNSGSTPGRRRLQDPATLAWNLCTASFFKAGGRPWRLANVRKGVCYVGLVFKKLSTLETVANACCGAQMFLDSGDGLVFKGAVGPWYSSQTREFHLPASEAAALVKTVVKSYEDIHHHPPHELFIHGRTRFDDAEWEGFRSGVPEGTNLVGVRITRSQDMKLFRPGTTPVLRGTAYRLNRARALLWTMGYIPRLQTYPGREVPNPLSIEICRGDADLSVVLEDVFRLTKVNFNTCIFADGLPVTLRFADAVGEILTAAPRTDGPPLPFRHYI